jgi:Ca-activated chloride channel family protein
MKPRNFPHDLVSPVGLLVAFACACGGAGGAGDDDPGGNVGFGGAQDIGQFRGILDAGGIPGEATLDANGFFAEHYIELPDADCGQVLCGHAMLSVGQDWQSGGYQATLQVALNTPTDPATLERKPLNLVVIVDTSGSMVEDDRIGYARQGLNLLIDQLDDTDRITLISFASEVYTRWTFAQGLDRPALHAIVDQLRADGATNIYGALDTGMGLLADSWDAERQNRVILLSDGQPTTGVTDTPSILSMASNYVEDGIGLTTVGVGTDFNVELMRGLAEYGAGNFYFLEDPAAVTEVFVDEIDYFMVPLATSLDFEVTPGPAYQLGEVVGTRLWKSDGAVGRVHVPAVFLASRTSASPDPEGGRRGGGSALFVKMTPASPGTSTELGQVATVGLSYRLPGATDRVTQSFTVTNPYDPGLTPEQAWFSHQAMEKNYAVYNVFLGLRMATRQAATSHNCALGTLDALRDATAAWNATREDPDLVADLQLVDQFRANLMAAGAVPSPTDAYGQCDGYDPNDPGYDDPYYGDDVQYACSAGGRGAGSAGGVLLFAIAVALRRRRR